MIHWKKYLLVLRTFLGDLMADLHIKRNYASTIVGPYPIEASMRDVTNDNELSISKNNLFLL